MSLIEKYATLADAIEAIRGRSDKVYTQLTINLGTVRDNVPFEMVGSYFIVLAASDDSASFNIRFNEVRSDSITMRRGRVVKTPFYRFFITNAAQAGITVTLEIGTELDIFEMQDTFPSSDVSDRSTRDLGFVRDYWFRELRAGRCFGRGTNLTAAAGNNAHVQLFNPAGSGVNIIVHSVIVWVGTAQIIRIMERDVAEVLVATGENLLNGGAASLGEIRTRDGVILANPPIVEVSIPVSTPFNPNPNIPWLYEIGPGEGVIIVANTIATQLGVTYLWNEVPA